MQRKLFLKEMHWAISRVNGKQQPFPCRENVKIPFVICRNGGGDNVTGNLWRWLSNVYTATSSYPYLCCYAYATGVNSLPVSFAFEAVVCIPVKRHQMTGEDEFQALQIQLIPCKIDFKGEVVTHTERERENVDYK